MVMRKLLHAAGLIVPLTVGAGCVGLMDYTPSADMVQLNSDLKLLRQEYESRCPGSARGDCEALQQQLGELEEQRRQMAAEARDRVSNDLAAQESADRQMAGFAMAMSGVGAGLAASGAASGTTGTLTSALLGPTGQLGHTPGASWPIAQPHLPVSPRIVTAGPPSIATSGCPTNLRHLASRLPSYPDPELQHMREVVLNQDLLQALQIAKSQGLTAQQAAAEALRQAQEYEQRVPQVEACIRSVTTDGETTINKLQNGTYIPGNGRMQGDACAWTYIAFYYGLVANKEAAIGLACLANRGG